MVPDEILPVDSPRVTTGLSAIGGIGVFATRRLPPYSFVATYPGRVYTEKELAEVMKNREDPYKYSLQYFELHPDGTVEEDKYCIDPSGNGPHGLNPRYMGVAPFVNEPVDADANMFWVCNYMTRTIDLYTSVSVRAGEELLACYGDMYARNYKTSCANSKTSLERHVVYDPDEQTTARRCGSLYIRPMRAGKFMRKHDSTDIIARLAARPLAPRRRPALSSARGD